MISITYAAFFILSLPLDRSRPPMIPHPAEENPLAAWAGASGQCPATSFPLAWPDWAARVID